MQDSIILKIFLNPRQQLGLFEFTSSREKEGCPCKTWGGKVVWQQFWLKVLYPRLELEACHVDAEARVGNSLLQIWELKFGHKAKLLFRL